MLRLVSSAVVGFVVGIVAILPFDLPSQAPAGVASIPVLGSIAGLLSVVGSAAAYYAVLTVNAFNAWAFVGSEPLTGGISDPNLFWTSDSIQVLGSISAVSLGAILLASLIVLVVATLMLRDDRTAILLGFTVLAVAFFAVPTRVHERYLFPAFATGALVAVMSPRWLWWYIALAVTNVANLHAILTLPYVGYATAGLRDLPLATFVRDPFVVGIIADLHTLLFVGSLLAFIKQATWPAVRGALGRRQTSDRPVASAPVTGPAPASTDTTRQPARPRRPRSGRSVWTGGAVGVLSRGGGVISRLRRRGRADAQPSAGVQIQPAPAPEGRGRLDRKDLAVFAAVVLVVFVTRAWRLETPRTMYFDERWHATTATEFLQDWRYGRPLPLSESTHPHLAKYLMAASLVAFGGDHVSNSGDLPQPVTDAVFEPTYLDGGAPGGESGDRIVAVTGSDVRVAAHGDLASATSFPLAGAISVAVDSDARSTYVGTSTGAVYLVASSELTRFIDLGVAPSTRQLAQLSGPVTNLWVVGSGRVAALSGGDRVSIVDAATTSVQTREQLLSLQLPGIMAVTPFGPPEKHLAALALPTGLITVDTTSMVQVQAFGVTGGVNDLVYVDGGDQVRRERDLLEQPTIYAATGKADLQTFTQADDGTLSQGDAVPMPGQVTQLRWDRPTNMVHVLGTSPAGRPTIYVVEPHGNAVFADAELPFQPTAWILDVQPADPGHDRERAVAFSSTGQYASVDVGSHAFAFRLPGVILGALTAGFLYLLARLLFRRRSVGLLFVGLLVIDGLLFQQARIAMNDVYVGFFIVVGFALLAYFVQSLAKGRRATLELLAIPPFLGVLFGLGLASKWVAAYAIGGAILIILLRSSLGRGIALVGMLALTSIFGYLAIAEEPPNWVFLIVMVGLTALLGFGIVRREGRDPSRFAIRSWLRSWRASLALGWVLACLVVVPVIVYVASYIPWAISTAGGPQLLAGWPAGHSGQTFLDLQVQMYRYHDEFRIPHGAGSPWWAWPLDLKPLWGYLETFVDGTQATVLGAGNPFLIWLSTGAVGFGAWEAWRRRSWALGFVVIAFLALWLPWARIDRVAFNYHYYVALPFAYLLLAWFLAELIDAPSERMVRLARAAFAIVLFMPTLLWAFKTPLCVVAGVGQVYPGAGICAAPLTDFALPVVAWTVFAAIVFFLGIYARSPRRMVTAMLGLAVVVSLALYPALSGAQLPNGWAWIYQGLLPSWDSTFQFRSNTAAAVSTPLLGLGSLAVLFVTLALTTGAVLLARLARGTRGGGDDANEGDELQIRSSTPMRRSTAEPAPATSPAVSAAVTVYAVAAAPPSGGAAVIAVAPARFGAIHALRSRSAPRSAIQSAVRSRELPKVSIRANLAWTLVALIVASLFAALIVDRFSGFGGPWLWNFDMSLANYPFASYFHEALAKGTLPLWNDRVGMGFPLYAEGQIGALYPPNWIIFQLPPLVALDVARILHLVLAGVGAGLIVLRMTGARAGALTAAAIVVLCGGIASKLEWTQVVTVYGWMPWVLLPLLWRRPAPTRGLIALAGVFWGIQALGGHPPYWVLTGLAAIVLILVQSPRLRGLGAVALFGFVGIAVGAVQLIPTALITTISWRAQGVGANALFEYSATPFDFLAIAFGNAFVPADGSSWNLYASWYPGGSVWATLEVYAYVGLPALAFAAVGLWTRRGRPLLILAAVMVAIPLLGVLQPGIWAAIPGLNGLRHPIRAYLVLDLVLAIGAGMGVARLGRARSIRPAAIMAGIVLGAYFLIVAVAAVIPRLFTAVAGAIWWYVPSANQDQLRQTIVDTMTRVWPLAFELVLAGLALVVMRGRLRRGQAKAAAVGLIVLPLVLLTSAVNQSQPLSAFSLEGTSIIKTLRSQTPGQVLSINEPFYSGFPTQLAGVGARDPHVYTSQFGLSLRLESSEQLIADLRTAGAGSAFARAVGVDTVVQFGGTCTGRLVATDVALNATVCRDDSALHPPYWLPISAVLSITDGGGVISPRLAIVNPIAVVKSSVPAAASSWSQDATAVRIDAPADGYVFMDRTWWPGWQVTVDGAPVSPLSSMGGHLIPVSAGPHAIAEHLLPWDLIAGLLVSLGAIVALLVWALWRRRPANRGLVESGIAATRESSSARPIILRDRKSCASRRSASRAGFPKPSHGSRRRP